MKYLIPFAIVVLSIPFVPATIKAEPNFTPLPEPPPPVEVVLDEIEEEPEEVCEDYTDYGCSCVIYIQNKGINIRGNAEDMIPNFGGIAEVGDVAIFHFPNIAHIAYVEIVYESGNFLVSEWNYREGLHTERVIMKNNPYLIGFLRGR